MLLFSGFPFYIPSTLFIDTSHVVQPSTLFAIQVLRPQVISNDTKHNRLCRFVFFLMGRQNAAPKYGKGRPIKHPKGHIWHPIVFMLFSFHHMWHPNIKGIIMKYIINDESINQSLKKKLTVALRTEGNIWMPSTWMGRSFGNSMSDGKIWHPFVRSVFFSFLLGSWAMRTPFWVLKDNTYNNVVDRHSWVVSS